MWEDDYCSDEDLIQLYGLFGYDEEYNKRKDMVIDSEVDKRNLKEFIDRYTFLYENSHLILGCLLNFFSISGHLLYGETDPLLYVKKEIGKKMGFSNHFYHLGESYDFIYLIEEAFLGNKSLVDTDLYKIISRINDNNYIFDYLKEEYNLEKIKGDSFHKLDQSFKMLLDCVFVFVNGQDVNFTLGNNGKKFWIFLLKEKNDVLNEYRNVFNYGLDKMGCVDSLRSYAITVGLNKKIDRTLVDNNDFLVSFCRDYTTCTKDMRESIITTDIKKELYYKYHDVIDWDLEIKCTEDKSINRSTNTSSCGTYFRINEGDLFFYEDNFYQLCPECSYIVKVDDRFISKSIGDRVKRKNLEDRYLARKMVLLSEYKSLVKKRD